MVRLLGVTLVGAIALGLVLRGRLTNLAEVRFRLAWLGLVGVALQLPTVSGTAGDLLLLASFLFLLAVVVVNLRQPGFPLILLGLALNLLVIGVNRGMPVSREAIVASGQASTLAELRQGDSPKHHLMGPEDRLTFLGDVIAIGPPIRRAVSAGDLAALLGIGWFVVGTMRRRQAAPALEASPAVPDPPAAELLEPASPPVGTLVPVAHPPERALARYRRVLSHRHFRLLLGAQTLTMFGDVALVLVLGIWVKSLTGSSGLAGWTFVLYTVPAIIVPLAGPIIDRLPRRRVMIATDLVTMGVALSLLLVRDERTVWLIYVVAFLYGALQIVFFAARSGLLVSMLPAEELAEANGMLESLRNGLRIVGPLAGAGLFALWGGGAVAILDAAAFLISAGILTRIRAPDLEPPEGPRENPLAELTAGARHILHTLDLRRVVLYTAAVLIFLGIVEVAVFGLIDEGLGRPPAFLGVLSTLEGAGAVVGGVAAAWVMARLGEVRMAGAAIAGFGLAVAFDATAVLPIVVVGSLLVGVFVAFYFVAYQTLLQRRTPVDLQGRVFTASEAITTVPYSISIGIGALIIDLVGFRALYLTTTAACLLGGGLLYRVASGPGSGATPAPGHAAPPDVAGSG
jgi:MFS family permease